MSDAFNSKIYSISEAENIIKNNSINKYELVYRLVPDKNIFLLSDDNHQKNILKIMPLKFISPKRLELLKEIKSRHLPTIIEYCVIGSEIAIIKTYVEGRTLYDIVEEEGVIEESQVINYLIEIIEALNVLHTRSEKLIFRDIHPKNIVVNDKGQVCLIDIESVRVYDSTKEIDTVMIGAIGFVAPEQYGFMQSDERSDIYSLGMVCYYMLTGAIPDISFNRMDGGMLECSGKFRLILNKMTRFSPDVRYSDLTRLKEAVENMGKLLSKTKKILSGIVIICLLMISLGSIFIPKTLEDNQVELSELSTENELTSNIDNENALDNTVLNRQETIQSSENINNESFFEEETIDESETKEADNGVKSLALMNANSELTAEAAEGVVAEKETEELEEIGEVVKVGEVVETEELTEEILMEDNIIDESDISNNEIILSEVDNNNEIYYEDVSMIRVDIMDSVDSKWGAIPFLRYDEAKNVEGIKVYTVNDAYFTYIRIDYDSEIKGDVLVFLTGHMPGLRISLDNYTVYGRNSLLLRVETYKLQELYDMYSDKVKLAVNIGSGLDHNIGISSLDLLNFRGELAVVAPIENIIIQETVIEEVEVEWLNSDMSENIEANWMKVRYNPYSSLETIENINAYSYRSGNILYVKITYDSEREGGVAVFLASDLPGLKSYIPNAIKKGSNELYYSMNYEKLKKLFAYYKEDMELAMNLNNTVAVFIGLNMDDLLK